MIGFNTTVVLPQNFQPNWFSGCQLWLRSDQGITTATGVSQWNDLSGNANNAVQSTGMNQPAYSGNDSNWNRKPSLTYSSGQFMQIADAASLKITGAITIVAVIRSSTETVALNTLISKGTTSCEFDSYTDNFTTNLVRGSTAQGIVGSGAANNVNTSYILTTDQSSNQQFYFNGVSQTLTTNLFGAGTVSTNPINIGRRADGSTQLTGSVVEYIIFNRYLTAPQVAELHAYQVGLWGIA